MNIYADKQKEYIHARFGLIVASSTDMEEQLILTVGESLDATLQSSHAPLMEITSRDFRQYQQRYKLLRSMIYKSEEEEVESSDSKVTYFSLCYIRRNNKPTRYYVSTTIFRVPPSEFLGEKEERDIIRWFVHQKGKFLIAHKPARKHLTDADREDIEACAEVFKQLPYSEDEELLEQINET